MTLDVVRVSSQLQEMGSEFGAHRAERRERLDRAREAFHRLSKDWEELANDARSANRPTAVPLGPMDQKEDKQAPPSSYEVLATDGSTIEPDRHGPAMCALINVGRVRIRYGSAPFAALEAEPTLCFRPDDLYVEQGGRRLLLRERLLDARRSLAEMQTLSEMAEASSEPDLPSVALADGLLTIWRDDWATEEGQKVVADFSDALLRIGAAGLPVAAYVSNPSSHWVVDLLRRAAGCGESCTLHCGALGCVLSGPVDAELYGDDLQPGQRSGVFEVTQQANYHPDVRSHFFYLNVGREIVRVEVPAWVARDTESLQLVHNVLCDQVERGQGYPTALARAHEQAVLSGHDRLIFQQLVIESLARAGLGAEASEKQISKNRRAV